MASSSPASAVRTGAAAPDSRSPLPRRASPPGRLRARLSAAALALAGALLAPAAPAVAQPDLGRRIGTTVADTGAPGYRFERLRLASADGRRHYRVHVALPAAATGPHPVAYLLDGNAALEEVDAALFARLAALPRPPVVAFIAHDSDLRIDADARAFDYTPRRPGGDDAQRDAVPGRRNGGADAFLDLIAAQVVPRVEALAQVDPARRALWGHSYGGVLVLHALFTRPRAFAIHAATDPSLWWGDGRLHDEEAAAAWVPPLPRLWLWLGDGPAPATGPARDPARVRAMRVARAAAPPDAAQRMADRLRERGLEVRLRTLDGRSHGDTLGASLAPLLEALAGATGDAAP